MMIDNREWTEPEIKAYMRNHESQTEQLENIIDRLEVQTEQLEYENQKLTKKLGELGDENKVLMSECDRLIKEKGELLSKVSGGDVLKICQLEEQLKEAKKLLKSAIDEWNLVCEWGDCGEYCGWYQNGRCTQEWSGKAEALKLIGGE